MSKELQRLEQSLGIPKEVATVIKLNSEPPKRFIKKHPFVKKKVDGRSVPYEYIPIQYLEYMMTKIFLKWSIEVIDYKLLANSVTCHIRVHTKDRDTGEMFSVDGVGAAPLQTSNGAGAIEFNELKSGAVQMALPAAKSYAFKDAVECLGKVFGKDMNRADQVHYDSIADSYRQTPTINLLLKKIDSLTKDKQDYYKEMIQEKKQAGELNQSFIDNLYNEI